MSFDHLDDIFEEDWPEDHRSGIIAVVGRPNVGKSTLINRILGQKIAIVTNKPQTTRKQQLGIYTQEKGQILFVDTPGLHRPHHRLGEYMVNVAEQALKDADMILWVLDASEPPEESDRHIAETVSRLRGKKPVVLVLNKTDLTQDNADFSEHLGLIEHQNVQKVSALSGLHVQEMLDYVMSQMPLGPRYYPADQVSEVNMRFIASEVIREKIIENTEQEIPYSVAVEISEYREREDNMTYINAVMYVERDSQKGIIIGKNGDMIKKIGVEARQELATIIGTRIYLDLHVKVLENWRHKVSLLRRLGYRIPKEDDR